MSHLAFASQGHLSSPATEGCCDDAHERVSLYFSCGWKEHSQASTSGDSENCSLKTPKSSQDATALQVHLCSDVFLHTKWHAGGIERNKDIFPPYETRIGYIQSGLRQKNLDQTCKSMLQAEVWHHLIGIFPMFRAVGELGNSELARRHLE